MTHTMSVERNNVKNDVSQLCQLTK